MHRSKTVNSMSVCHQKKAQPQLAVGPRAEEAFLQLQTRTGEAEVPALQKPCADTQIDFSDDEIELDHQNVTEPRTWSPAPQAAGSNTTVADVQQHEQNQMATSSQLIRDQDMGRLPCLKQDTTLEPKRMQRRPPQKCVGSHDIPTLPSNSAAVPTKVRTRGISHMSSSENVVRLVRLL